MQIKPFLIEQFFGKYEFTAKYLLSSSDAESRTIQELLDLEPGSHERFLQHWCGYTESPGAPSLREAIAGIYAGIHPDEVLVVAAAEEAFSFFTMRSPSRAITLSLRPLVSKVPWKSLAAPELMSPSGAAASRMVGRTI